MSIKPDLNNHLTTFKLLNSKEVSIICACSLSTIQKSTKKALNNGLNVININNSSFTFEAIKSKSGKAYTYTQIKSSKIRTKNVKSIGFALLSEISGFDITKTKHSPDEKALIIAFYNKYNYSLNTIIKALYIDKNIYPDTIKIASMIKKVKRWCETFKQAGIKALEDKRGYKATNLKIDEELLTLAVTGAGSRGIRDNYYGAWEFYNYLKAKQEGILDKPKFALANTKTTKLINGVKSYISYSAFVLAVKRLYNKNPQIKSYMKHGKDALLQDYVVGIKDVGYINQEWQVDSTKFDFMCKIPTQTGYKIGQVNLTAVIDVYSKKAVVSLSETIDSYAQVRVLNKAFTTFGMPESIYTNNGRDYVSKHYSGVLAELGITHLKAKVGQGRQKGAIERFFGVTQSSWASLPGYIGENVEKRVKIENQSASKIDIRTSKATRINKDRLLSLDELKEAVYTLMNIKNITYDEFKQFKLSPEKLEFIKSKLGKTKEATLQTSGVRFNNYIYQSADL